MTAHKFSPAIFSTGDSSYPVVWMGTCFFITNWIPVLLHPNDNLAFSHIFFSLKYTCFFFISYGISPYFHTPLLDVFDTVIDCFVVILFTPLMRNACQKIQQRSCQSLLHMVSPLFQHRATLKRFHGVRYSCGPND